MRFARWALAGFLISGAVQAQPAAPKVLRVVPSADLTQLDPGFASIVITRICGLMVYETLFAWDVRRCTSKHRSAFTIPFRRSYSRT